MIPDLLAGFRIVIPVDGYLGGAAFSRQTKMLGYLVLVESHRQVAAFLHLKHLSQAAAMRRLIRPADAPPLGRIRKVNVAGE
jgi:hypothetical protein